MKTISILFLFILIITQQLFAQTASASASVGAAIVKMEEGYLSPVKAFDGRYVNGKVYLHITVNGNNETNYVAVERSLDKTNYEVIGFVKLHGITRNVNLAYYYTDENPIKANLYYRLSGFINDEAFCQTVDVIAIENQFYGDITNNNAIVLK